MCACRDPNANSGTIGGIPFHNGPHCSAKGVCAPYPTSELLTDRTGKFVDNGICDIKKYGGGLFCCHDGVILLDADQKIPEPLDTFQLKYRFYFEDYTNQTNAYRVWWSTEAYNNEYDVPQSKADCNDPKTPAEQCIHEIKSVFTGADMARTGCMANGDPNGCMDLKKIAAQGGYYKLVYAAFHCHAPACMSGELWDMDKNELICRNQALYGNSSQPMNEAAMVVGIPPCLWGDEPGMKQPPLIHLTSNLTTIKKVNNTYGHWGVMALWQNRASYVH